MEKIKVILSKKSTIAVLLILLLLGITGNIVQVIAMNNLRANYDQDSLALQKFRDLQERQIDAVVKKCNYARGNYTNDYGVMKSIRNGFVRLGLPDLLQQYVKDENMGNCYAAVFTLLGEKDLDAINEYRMMQVSDDLYVLKDGIFDEVKW